MDPSAAGLDASYRIPLSRETRDFAVLDDVDAQAVGGARVTPGHRSMAYGAGSSLEQSPVDGKAALRRVVQEGQKPLHVGAIEQRALDAIQAHGVALTGQHIELNGTVRQYQLSALGQHDVEIELVGQPFPQLQ